MEGFARLRCPSEHKPTHWPACPGPRFWERAAGPRDPGPTSQRSTQLDPPPSPPESGGVSRQRPPPSQSHRALGGALLMTSGMWLAARVSLRTFPVSTSPLPGARISIVWARIAVSLAPRKAREESLVTALALPVGPGWGGSFVTSASVAASAVCIGKA